MMFLTAYTILSSTENPVPLDLIKNDGFDQPFKQRQSVLLPSQLNPKALTHQLRASKETSEGFTINVAWITNSSEGNVYTFKPGSPEHLAALRNLSFVPETSKKMPSQAPIGLVRIYGGSKSIRPVKAIFLYCETQWSVISVGWDPPMTKGADGFAARPIVDMETREAWVEKVVRRTLANATGLRIEASSNGALAGHNVSRAKRRGSNVMFGDMNQWFSASGWGIAEEDKFGLLHLKRGSDWAVLPLGADQIKVNGVWKEMGDSAAFFNGKLYLPAAGLEHLRKA